MIDELDRLPWFHCVGQSVSDNVYGVSSWAEAMRLCSTAEWESVQRQVNNLLFTRVNEIDYERYKSWNPTVAEINARLEPMLKQHVAPVAMKHRLGQRFLNSVAWDVMEICIETEFADICQPIFFLDRVLPWYQCGHFPCGWDGPMLETTWQGPIPCEKLFVF